MKEKKYPWLKKYNGIREHFNYPDISMYELLKITSLKYPESYAYQYYGTKVTYKGFLSKINKCAQAYQRLGIKKGDVFTIIMPNTPEALISFYAINKIGGICNMVHPQSSEEEMKFAIELTQSKNILCADIAYPKLAKVKDKLDINKIIYVPVSESMDIITKIGYRLTLGKGLNMPFDPNIIPYKLFVNAPIFAKEEDVEVKGNDTAVILYSGGTTGTPKGIELTNLNFNAMVMSEVELNRVIKHGLTYLAVMPIFHGFGLGCTFHACFYAGAEAIILPTVNPKTFDDVLLKYKPNIIAAVPSLLEGLPYSKKLQKESLSFIKCIACGGDVMTAEKSALIDGFFFRQGCDARVIVAYGMTECTAGVTMMPSHDIRPNCIGIPAPDNVIKIVKPNTEEELPYGEIGEICISGPTLMKGYLKNEKETKNVLKKHKDGVTWLHSGDAGYMDEDGFIYFTSRIKRMIISSGYNVYPGQIEQIINNHPLVKTCAVVGVPHPYKKEVIKAYIVLKDGIELSQTVKKDIKDYCKKNIASYALPYAYGYRKELPKTKVGKIAYRELEKDNQDEKDI